MQRNPPRGAAVDVGSNALRFVAAELGEEPRELDAERVALRLGTEAFRDGALSEATLGAALAALRGFRRRMDALGIVEYRAVATSAVREARNGSELARRAWSEAGLRLEVIDAAEEARLVWAAVRPRVEIGDAAALLVDLGGGSLEVSRVAGEAVEWSESGPYGTVRLLGEIPADRPAAEAVLELLQPMAATLERRLGGEKAAALLATGGNIEALAGLAGAEAEATGVQRLPLATLREWAERLSGLSLRERIQELGLAPDRADVIVPAALVYARIAELAGAAEVRVANAGVKEGVLLRLGEAARQGRAARDPHRVAFLSDVHANVLALREALALAAARGVGGVVVAGDVVGDGPHPLEVVRMLQVAGAQAIRGNVDRKVLKVGEKRKKVEKQLEKARAKKRNRGWAALQLRGTPEREWLESLPAELRLEIGGTDVLVVHGSPHGDSDYLYPSLTAPGLENKLAPLEGPRPRVLVSGHSHVPFTAEVDGVLVVNCGSVGHPSDGDPRGSLVLAQLHGERAAAEVLRFDYPVEALAADVAELDVPGADADDYRNGTK